MSFTDDDLERLKDGMSHYWTDYTVTVYSRGRHSSKISLEALVARLEAAERVLALKPNQHRRTLMAEWRKAAGK